MAALRAAAANPVHAYLFRGPPGRGGLAATYGFAAALLCPDGGCGQCATCRAALAGTDPDLHVVRRSGASVTIGEIRQVVGLAQRRPLHARRQVIVMLDIHLAVLRAPALLKTLEEPPGDTVFVLLVDEVVPELATVASRCVEVVFPPVARDVMARWLTDSGVPADTAAGWPTAAGAIHRGPGSWSTTPTWRRAGPVGIGARRIHTAGFSASRLAQLVLAWADRATEPLRAAHAREIEALTAAAKEMGERGLPGRKEIVEQHQREERRLGTDTLHAGLGVLARTFRGRVVGAASSGRRSGSAIPMCAARSPRWH